MAKKLTPAQRKAREIVREAARRVIAEFDSSNARRQCVEFDAHFHLNCWQHQKGNPNHKLGWPVYVPLLGRVQVAAVNGERHDPPIDHISKRDGETP